jgi:hypothetical protein
MILGTAARTGVSAARTAARLAASAGSHAAWWLDYRVGRRPRPTPHERPQVRRGTPKR